MHTQVLDLGDQFGFDVEIGLIIVRVVGVFAGQFDRRDLSGVDDELGSERQRGGGIDQARNFHKTGGRDVSGDEDRLLRDV